MRIQDIDNFMKSIDEINISSLERLGTSIEEIKWLYSQKKYNKLGKIIYSYKLSSSLDYEDLMQEENPWSRKDYSNL